MTPNEYKTARELIGTQGAVAEMLGVARTTVARRELGLVPITLEAQLAIVALGARGRKRRGRG